MRKLWNVFLDFSAKYLTQSVYTLEKEDLHLVWEMSSWRIWVNKYVGRKKWVVIYSDRSSIIREEKDVCPNSEEKGMEVVPRFAMNVRSTQLYCMWNPSCLT